MRKLFLASYFAETAGLLPDFAGVDLTGKRVEIVTAPFGPDVGLPIK
jgi:hypothetical protein